ncbi:hypothetical protein [Dactylosporangium sp. NPDC051541]|uniref:hypothetical protein n=1 Tax=Dactylosporangium sp. NPDC051541 TaxID=3363977 RepID=UPI0037AB5509
MWAIVALGWSVGTAAAGVGWALGAPGAPFGTDDRAVRMGAVLTGLSGAVAGIGIALLGLVLAGVAVTAWRSARVSAAVRVAAWVAAGGLLLVVPDGRLLLAVGEVLAGHPGRVEAAALTQGWFAVGGVLWGLVAYGGRARETVVPRWGRAVTLVAAALPLGYALPRLLWAAGLRFGLGEATAGMVATAEGRQRELIFALACIGGGVLTLGLVQRWGTWVPWWVAAVPATAVAVVLTGAGFTMWRSLAAFEPADWAAWAGNLIWLPWGVTLGMATFAYVRRRRATG